MLMSAPSVKLVWSDEASQALLTIKDAKANATLLTIMTDASDIAV